MTQFSGNVHLFCFLPIQCHRRSLDFLDCLPADGLLIIRKGATLIYNHQVVTSENKNKVRVLSHFPPQPPPVDLSAVDSFIDLVSVSRKQLTSWQFVRTLASKDPADCYVHLPGSCR